MSKGKKIALIVSMVAVLVVAAVLNVTLLAANNNEPNGEIVQTSSFFTSSRLDRQTQRNYLISELDEIIAIEGEENAQARQNAIAKKLELIDVMETELLIETILKGRGFDDVLVTINSESNSASVMVDKDALDDQDTAIIYTVVAAESGIGWQYIKILCV